MIMCVLLCYPVSIHMSQLLSTGRPISSFLYCSCIHVKPEVPYTSSIGHFLSKINKPEVTGKQQIC